MRTRFIFVVVATLASGLLAPGPTAVQAAVPPAPDELVAFWSMRSGVGEVRLVKADTASDIGSLTAGLGLDVKDPAWSEDGTTIVFAGRTPGAKTHDLYKIAVEGGPLVRLTATTAEERQPVFSPNGLTIAFARGNPEAGRSRIMAINSSNGSGPREITQFTSDSQQWVDAAPAWSPSGVQIAFATNRDGGLPRIYRANANGTNSGLTPLTTSPCIDGNPSWAPGGAQIAFDRTCPGAADPTADLMTMPAAGGLATEVLGASLNTSHEFDPDWDPDGQGLAFSLSPEPGGDRNIATVSVPGGALTPLTTASRSDLGPSWHHLPRGNPSNPCDVVGTTGSDPSTTLNGTSGQVVCGLGGDDTFAGGTGIVMRGGGGSDTADYSSAPLPPVTANLSNGTNSENDILGGIENLKGTNLADTLTGNSPASGISGANVLTGGGGGDTLDGQGGVDTASYATSAAGVTVNLSVASAQSGGDAQGDTLGEIENVSGSPGNDVLTGDGQANVLSGLGGDDQLRGGEGNDLLIGGPQNDLLDGQGGTDTGSYNGAAPGVTVTLGSASPQNTVSDGTDTLSNLENLIGSAHPDVLTGNNGGNSLAGGDGNDRLNGAGGLNTLLGGKGNDTLIGGSSNDRLFGEDGNDVATGGGGGDHLDGGTGNDRLLGDAGNDSLSGASGADSLSGGEGADTLAGNTDADALGGGPGNDRADGGDGPDDVRGNGGRDTLHGNADGDAVRGGKGRDRLFGDQANDRLFSRDRFRDRVEGGSGRDKARRDRRDRVGGVESSKRDRRFRRVRRRTVAPGIKLNRIRDKRGPRRIFVLRVDPATRATLDVALSNDKLTGFERTTSMAARSGAIAAVNGDFGLDSGQPAGHFAQDGILKQTSDAFVYQFALSSDDRQAFFGNREVRLESIETEAGERWTGHRWNDAPPSLGEIAAYSAAGAGVSSPSAQVCWVRLASPTDLRWRAGQDGVERDYDVSGQPDCGGAAPAAPTGTQVVLTARPQTDEARFLRSLADGEDITLGWTMSWRAVLDTIAGYPRLLQNGEIVVGSCPQSFCRRQPRTGIGVTASGKLLLVAVDGRRKKRVGMTLLQFAREMARLGAVSAINLDGGGSTTMVVKGKIVNKPSDGSEREVSSALLVLAGPDGSAPASVTPRVLEAPQSDATAATLALEDPGSTGGFLDALDAGALQPPIDLGAELEQLLARFRASRQERNGD